MKNITLKQAQKLTAPNPFCLIATLNKEGKANLMAVSWWTFMSNQLPSVIICIGVKSYTGSLLLENGEFTLNVVGKQLAENAFRCGICSGRDVNKAQKYGLGLLPSEKLAAPIVADSRVSLECRVFDKKPVADHILFMAEVVAAHGDESVEAIFAFDGYSRLAVARESV